MLIEAHDEWQVAERRYLSEGSMAKLTQTGDDDRRPKEGEQGNRRTRHHLTTSSSTVTEVHDDALISTTPWDAAGSGQYPLRPIGSRVPAGRSTNAAVAAIF